MNAKMFVAAIAVAVLGACNDRDPVPVDASLSGDLALAASSQPYQPQQYVSPMEQGYAPAPVYAQPAVYRPQPAPPPRQRTATRAPQTTRYPAEGSGDVVRNTKRDAVIGATAGAVIGATTSRDKVKGAIVGAAVGGVLGGIVGHTIDVERRP